MKTLLSQLGDHTKEDFSRLCQLYPVPTYVKQAAVHDVFETPEGSTDFADKLGGDFPLHSKAATYVSCMYFFAKQASLSPQDVGRIADRLGEASRFWEIADDILTLQRAHVKLAEASRPSFDDDDYAFVSFDPSSGEKIRKLRIANTKEVRAAADWLLAHRDQLVYRDRRMMAERILHKQAQFGADLSDCRGVLSTIAGQGLCDPNDAVRMLNDRASLLPKAKSKIAQELRKCAAAIAEDANWLPTGDDLEFIAATVDSVDRDCGLHLKYGSGVRRPEEILFQHRYDEIRDLYDGLVETKSGSLYKKADLLKLRPEEIRDVLGEDFAQHVCVTPIGPRPEIFAKVAEMPLDQEDRLNTLLRQLGSCPVKDNRPRRAAVLTTDEWRQLVDA